MGYAGDYENNDRSVYTDAIGQITMVWPLFTEWASKS